MSTKTSFKAIRFVCNGCKHLIPHIPTGGLVCTKYNEEAYPHVEDPEYCSVPRECEDKSYYIYQELPEKEEVLKLGPIPYKKFLENLHEEYGKDSFVTLPDGEFIEKYDEPKVEKGECDEYKTTFEITVPFSWRNVFELSGIDINKYPDVVAQLNREYWHHCALTVAEKANDYLLHEKLAKFMRESLKQGWKCPGPIAPCTILEDGEPRNDHPKDDPDPVKPTPTGKRIPIPTGPILCDITVKDGILEKMVDWWNSAIGANKDKKCKVHAFDKEASVPFKVEQNKFTFTQEITPTAKRETIVDLNDPERPVVTIIHTRTWQYVEGGSTVEKKRVTTETLTPLKQI